MADGREAVPVSIVGLPASGKTTFLAALWELVCEDRVAKALQFHAIGSSDQAYLRKIVEVWRSAKEQARTELTGTSSVSMTLADAGGRVVRVTIPDVPGEAFRSMWEDRELDDTLLGTLSTGNILLLLHGNKIKAPAWVTERAALRRATKAVKAETAVQEWEPKFAPTQVQLVDLLQLTSHEPVGCPGRKVAVVVSAWDKAEGEGLDPGKFLDAKLPMLSQYLAAGRDRWDYRVYGVSAQGGDYDENDRNKASPKKGKDAERLRDIDIPAERIRLVCGTDETHDLTGPLLWLMD